MNGIRSWDFWHCAQYTDIPGPIDNFIGSGWCVSTSSGKRETESNWNELSLYWVGTNQETDYIIYFNKEDQFHYKLLLIICSHTEKEEKKPKVSI